MGTAIRGNLLFGTLGALRMFHRPAMALMILKTGFNLMDLLFYAIGAYTGYRTALKRVPASPAAS